MRIISCSLAVFFCVSCATTNNNCNPWSGTEVSSIGLQKDYSGRAFYFRAGVNYAIRLREEDIQTNLESNLEDQGVPFLLAEIKKDLPLKTDTDLFKYALVNGASLEAIEFCVADLLREGRASVVFVPGKGTSDYVIDKIKVVEEVFSGEVSASMFCTPFNYELLSVRSITFD